MDQKMLGNDFREELPDVPDEVLDPESVDEDCNGGEMYRVEPWDDGGGEPDFGDDEVPESAEPVMSRTVGAGEPAEPKGPPPMFDSLEAWVHGWLLPLYRRSLDGSAVTFCREWWRHPEAYLRLDALWKSWEYYRRKPGTGMAVWLRDYCDQHMAVLMREQGTFKGCTIEAHNVEYSLQPWVLAPMPTPLDIARLYDRQGVQYARPELDSVRAQPWDGVDQK